MLQPPYQFFLLMKGRHNATKGAGRSVGLFAVLASLATRIHRFAEGKRHVLVLHHMLDLTLHRDNEKDDEVE